MFEVIFVMLEDMIIPCLKLVYEDSIQIVLTYLHYVSKYFHTMYEDMFTQRHPVDGIFTKCLNPYSFKIDPIVLTMIFQRA